MDRILDNGLISPSRKRRLVSIAYESLLLFDIVFIADYLFDTLTQSRHGLMLRHERQAWLFFVLGLYFVWFWVHGGQTLAMKTWHIRVVRYDSSPLTFKHAIVRFLWCWPLTLSGLGLLYSLFDKNGQFLQDRLSKTLLVSTKPKARGVEKALRIQSRD